MPLRIQLVYESAEDLGAHLREHAARGALLIETSEDLTAVSQYQPVLLEVRAGSTNCQIRAEVLQVLPGTGMAVQLVDLGDAALLAASVAAESSAPKLPTVEVAALVSQPAAAAEPAGPALGLRGTAGGQRAESEDLLGAAPEESPEESLGAAPEESPAESLGAAPEQSLEESPAADRPGPRGSGPLSWSMDNLRANWETLTLAEKVRVARYGSKPMRTFVLRGTDKSLHVHVLQNPNVSLEEIALMAGMANLDAAVLRRIATRLEWQKNPAIARALLANPKLPLPLVGRLLRAVPRDELFRLSRTGKLRAPVREAVMKFLDRHR